MLGHPSLLLLLVAGISGVIIARVLLGTWCNHLSIYSIMWFVSLFLYELRLISYKQLTAETWFFIIIAWFLLYVGSATVVFARAALTANQSSPKIANIDLRVYTKPLKRAIVILSVLSFLAIISQWFILLKEFGDVKTILTSGYSVYEYRLEGGLSRSIPYFTSFALSAVAFAGIYTAIRGKITLLSLLPFALIVMNAIAFMGRQNCVFAVVLFGSCYLLSPKYSFFYKKKTTVSVIIPVILMLVSIDFITTVRKGIGHYKAYGEAKILSDAREHNIFFVKPSIYLYLSGSPVVFSEFLKAGNEKSVYVGSRTFPSFYNILSRLGLCERPSGYARFYATPVPINTGTYLRDVYMDFAFWGITLFPYLLGIVCTSFYLNLKKKPDLLYIIIIAHLYLFVLMSIWANIIGRGGFVISLLGGLIAGIIIKSRTHRKTYPARAV